MLDRIIVVFCLSVVLAAAHPGIRMPVGGLNINHDHLLRQVILNHEEEMLHAKRIPPMLKHDLPVVSFEFCLFKKMVDLLHYGFADIHDCQGRLSSGNS